MKSKVFYHGPSVIDGAEIVGVITYDSKNSKTGAGLAQTWIMRADMAPSLAQKTGHDESVCGNCRLRPSLFAPKALGEKECYVITFHAPRSVLAAFQRGSYGPVVERENLPELARGWNVRLGSYGNPSAIPSAVWESLMAEASGWTGYDHLWNHPNPAVRANSKALQRWCMASVDSEESARAAWADGWRTFRTMVPGSPMIDGECRCPASKEAGHLTTCDKCQACSGLFGRGHSSIAIDFHP